MIKTISKIFCFLIFINFGFASYEDINITIESDTLITEQYSVVVDAGSTGSRAFIFKIDLFSSGKRIITSKSCGKVRNGLSTFYNNHSAASDYLLPLLENAKNNIPEEYHTKAILYIKGTAGMRLLSDDDQLLIWDNLAKDLNKRSDIPFYISRNNFGTISGHLEAFYAVLSSNYIVGSIDGNLNHIEGTSMIGALDLGGSSTQLILYNGSYHPNMPVNASQFWSHSWLHYGAEIIRERVLKHIYDMHIILDNDELISNTYDASLNKEKEMEILSDDINNNNNKTSNNKKMIPNPCSLVGYYDAYDVDFIFEGTGKPLECIQLIERVVWADLVNIDIEDGEILFNDVDIDGYPIITSKSKMKETFQDTCKPGKGLEGPCPVDTIFHPPVEGHHFYAMSVYFYAIDCIKHFNPDPFVHWPTPTIAEIETAAIKFCEMSWNDLNNKYMNEDSHRYTYPSQLPYRCLEALYIVKILEKGFGFNRNERMITLALEVEGKEVEWTLGFVLSDQHTTNTNNDYTMNQSIHNVMNNINLFWNKIINEIKNNSKKMFTILPEFLK